MTRPHPIHDRFSYFLDFNTLHVLPIIAISILMGIGAFVGLFGLRLFRTSTLLISGVVAFLITTTIVAEYSDDVRAIFIPGIIAAVVFGLFCMCVISIGIKVLALAVGFVYGFLMYIGFLHYISTWNLIILYVAVGVVAFICFLVAFIAEKEMILVATSFVGGFLVFKGVDLFIDNKMSLSNLGRKDNLSGEGWGFLIACIVLGAIFLMFQLFNPATGAGTHHYCAKHHRQHCPRCHVYHSILHPCPYQMQTRSQYQQPSPQSMTGVP